MSKSILEQADILGQAFNSVITKKFGSKRAPEPLFFSTGVKHLDSLLGGGIISSGPVMVTSTPETGKSTFAYQMAKQIYDNYENSISVYLDIEGSGGSTKSTQFRVSRVDTFGLNDTSRFLYQSIVLNVMELFELIETLIETKKLVEKKTGNEFVLLIIWDSIPSTPSSKSIEATDPNKIIGLKGRQLSFLLDKYLPLFKFNRVFFIGIDQVRADIQIDMFAKKEQSVGMFNDMKAASNIFSLQHNVQQWIFLSKTKQISQDSHYGIDGWELNIMTEKNKVAPSKNYITCVFDKYKGIDKFWSEFVFLSEMTYTEKKTFKKPEKLRYPLLITNSSEKKSSLKVYDKDKKLLYESPSMYKKEFKNTYNSNPEFQQWFDYAVDISCYERITEGMFKINDDLNDNQISEVLEVNEQEIEIEQQLNDQPILEEPVQEENIPEQTEELVIKEPNLPQPPEEENYEYQSTF
jgi:RecA/RadA recombinase